MVDTPATSARSTRITIPASLAKYFKPGDAAISDSSDVVVPSIRYSPTYVHKSLHGDHRSHHPRLSHYMVINRADAGGLPTWRDDAVAGTRLG